MKLINIKSPVEKKSFAEAIFHPLAADGGLYLPEVISKLPNSFIEELSNLSFHDISEKVLFSLLGEDVINRIDLQKIISDAFSFPAETKIFSDKLSILELFHGPTMAFKDFGARFMARTMAHFMKPHQKVKIVVATSGDTGGAVASGFYNVPGIEVYILYPKNMVSPLQEKQMTTLGANITAIELETNFDECQDLVKKCFTDSDLLENGITTANSINIARLLPQVTYYFESFKQLQKFSDVVYCVPSGNFGDITAGLIAQQMGLPISHFIAAHNANKTVVDFLETGTYASRKAVPTLSNAMDIGNPSNFSRFSYLLDNQYDRIYNTLSAYSVSDEETTEQIKKFHTDHDYVLDPHGAVGMHSAELYQGNNPSSHVCVLETAHPCKFESTTLPLTGVKSVWPEEATSLMNKETLKMTLSPDFETIKELILS